MDRYNPIMGELPNCRPINKNPGFAWRRGLHLFGAHFGKEPHAFFRNRNVVHLPDQLEAESQFRD